MGIFFLCVFIPKSDASFFTDNSKEDTSITDAINVFLAQVILQDGIPFEIKKPKFNKETIQAIEDTKNVKNLSRTFDSVDEMFEELDN